MKPYQKSSYTLEDAAHLSRRAMFGATVAQITELRELGPRRAAERLLQYPVTELPSNPFDPTEAVNGGSAARLAMYRWLHEMIYSPYPLREKLALMWSNHFVIGTDKVRQAGLLSQYLGVLREHGLGNFGRLTLEVSRSPAMLLYLDNRLNKKTNPNENFARELLELFTTGIGHYTERDVQEGARAFTGWAYRLDGTEGQKAVPEFVFQRGQHDTGVKTYLGVTGPLTGEEAIELSVRHPATARFVSHRLWRAFVNDTPEETGVESLADVWRGSNGDLREVMLALLTSEDFYAHRHRFAIMRSPAEFVVGALRALGQPALGDERRYALMVNQMSRMGQALLNPPTVEGWKGGMEWLHDTAVLTRMQVAAALTLGTNLPKPPPAGELSLALLGVQRCPFEAAIRQLPPQTQAYMMMISPEFALV